VELFRGVNVDWLRLKWYFLGFSLIFSISGIVSMAVHMHTIGSPVPLGVDFQGGTQVQVRFNQAPDIERIRPRPRRASRTRRSSPFMTWISRAATTC